MAMKFELTDAQVVKLKEWQEKIKDLFGEYGNYTYSFTPTGIGDGVEVWSDLTKTKLDLTDVDTW
jgi:hypothetical protein